MNIAELYKKEKKYLVNLILNQRKELKLLNKHKKTIKQLENAIIFWENKHTKRIVEHQESNDIYEKIIKNQKDTILLLMEKCKNEKNKD